MKMDSLKLEFFLGHWPELFLQVKQQHRNGKEWPYEYVFLQEPGCSDSECMVEITKAEYQIVSEAVHYYVGE